jgi:deoxycytidylate deaminase
MTNNLDVHNLCMELASQRHKEIFLSKNLDKAESTYIHSAALLPVKRRDRGNNNLIKGINSMRPNIFRVRSTHAEIDVLIKLLNHKISKLRYLKFILIVIRITKSGKLTMSRPCKHCLEILSRSGIRIREVHYSTTEGTIANEKFSDLISSDNKHTSRGFS